jgi:hypothetical protein
MRSISEGDRGEEGQESGLDPRARTIAAGLRYPELREAFNELAGDWPRQYH